MTTATRGRALVHALTLPLLGLALLLGAPAVQAQTSFTALLSGSNEVPPVETAATGSVSATLSGTTLTVTGAFSGLETDYNADIGSHLHGAPRGENGPVRFVLDPALDGDNRGGTYEAAANTFELSEAQVDSLQRGLYYVNIHTVGNPSGELRGQLLPPTDFSAILSGSNEVPPVETGATGSVLARLDGSTLVVTGSFAGLESPFNTEVGAHLHIGGPDENGPVDIVLDPTLSPSQLSGSFEAASNTFELTAEQRGTLLDGLYYVNIHSEENPAGEIRGQLRSLADVISIAEARMMGTDVEVTVEGTVSRALGQFTYLQDATGGITIRQPDSEQAFFQDVEAGVIRPGTVVRVTGTTSEFASLFQINDEDLFSYEVRGQATTPTPQVVTLTELATNGEAYEAELVRVTDATIEGGAGGTFETGTNYDLTDATGSLVLRIGNAQNTLRDDTGIPTGPVTVTSVLGQFNFDDPAAGYQLLPIQLADVAAPTQIIHNSPDPAAQTVDIYINADEDDAPALADVPFRAATGFLNLPAGVELTVSIAPGDSESVEDNVFQETYTLLGGAIQLIATGVLTPEEFPANPDEIATDFTLLVAGDAQQAAADPANVEFNVVHGAPNAPAVDVIARGVGPLFEGAPYTGITAYTSVAPNTYIIDITPAGSEDVVFSAVAPLGDSAGGALTVLASGFLGNPDGLPGFGLLAVFPDGTSTLLPPAAAGVQVIHNSPDPAAAVVDIYINAEEGDAPAIPDLAFRTATGFLPLPAGEDLTITVVPDGGALADGVPFVFNLDPQTNYQLIATGVLGDDLPENPEGISTDFTLLVREDALRRASSNMSVALSVVHGAPNAPTVDAFVPADPPVVLAEDAPYTGITDYTAVPPADYLVRITDADRTTTVAEFEAALTEAAGQAVTVLASGYLAPPEGLPAFGLLAVFGNGTAELLPEAVANEDDAGALPEAFALRGNYPNPFASTTRIAFDLPRDAEVTVQVFDVLGRTVAEVAPQRLAAGANQAIELDGARLASGAYVYRVEAQMGADVRVETGRLTLVK